MAQALSTRCGPRPRGLGLAPVKGLCRARCRATALAGRVYPWTSSAAIVAGLLLPVRGYWPMRASCWCRRALNGRSCIGDLEVFDRLRPAANAPMASTHSRSHHSLKSTTTGWVNFVSSAAREVRSVLCAHMRQNYVPSRQRVLARANGGDPFAHTPLNPQHALLDPVPL